MIRNKPVSHIIHEKIHWKQAQCAEYQRPTSITLGINDYHTLWEEFRLENGLSALETIRHSTKKSLNGRQMFCGIKINKSILLYLIRVNFPITENEKFRRQQKKTRKEIAKRMGFPEYLVKL